MQKNTKNKTFHRTATPSSARTSSTKCASSSKNIRKSTSQMSSHLFVYKSTKSFIKSFLSILCTIERKSCTSMLMRSRITSEKKKSALVSTCICSILTYGKPIEVQIVRYCGTSSPRNQGKSMNRLTTTFILISSITVSSGQR